jgi:hypothetical protein
VQQLPHRAGRAHTDSDCRAFLIDNPWSAAFISWVMVQSGVPGFNASPRHIDYIRARTRAALGPYGWSTRPPASRPHRATCCASCAAAHAQLQRAGAALGPVAVGRKSHCEVVVAANLGGDQTLYLVGGNVMNTVAMRNCRWTHRADPADGRPRTRQHRRPRHVLHTRPRGRMQLQPPGLGSAAAAGDRHANRRPPLAQQHRRCSPARSAGYAT